MNGGQVAVTFRSHLKFGGTGFLSDYQSRILNLFLPPVIMTSTGVSDAGLLTCKLVIGSVQLSGVRQALVTVFRLHFPRVRRNVELC